MAYNTFSTYAITGSLKAAITSGITTAITPGGSGIGRIAASAALGGISSKLQGGNFGHGFFSAGIGAIAGGVTKGINNPLAKILVATAVGGTVSKVTGGKFANGAFSGAFAAAFTADWSDREADPQHSLLAEMSNKAYEGKEGDKVGDYTITDIMADNNTGLRAALFIDSAGNKVIAYAGTDFFSWNDWKANILQAFGLESAQYTSGLKYAYDNGVTTFTGHSLGGGVAAYAALHTKGSAVIFNAAGLSSNSMSGTNGNDANITHYYSGYDAVSFLNAVSPSSVPGVQVNMGHAGGHLMGSMCKVMRASC